MEKVVRSAAAASKASTRKLDNWTTATSYQDLLTHLGTRTRNTAMVPGTEKTFELLSLPTPRQYLAMDLIDQHTKNHRKQPDTQHLKNARKEHNKPLRAWNP